MAIFGDIYLSNFTLVSTPRKPKQKKQHRKKTQASFNTYLSINYILYNFLTATTVPITTSSPQPRGHRCIKTRTSRSSVRFYLTGHSLGGGLAKLVALEVGKKSAPRVERLRTGRAWRAGQRRRQVGRRT